MFLSCMIFGVLCSVLSAFFLNTLLKKHHIQIPVSIWYLLWILPYLAGGFHTASAAITVVAILLSLYRTYSQAQSLRFVWNTSAIMCLVIPLAYCISPLWAADRGMAVFGILRYLPVILLAFFLMQCTAEQRGQFLTILPLCGTVMTLISCMLWALPFAKETVTVNGRLSGFLQYPNTFAAFLLIGIAVLGTQKFRRRTVFFCFPVLLAGLFLTGSRTGFLLLLFLLLLIGVYHKKIPVFLPAALFAAMILLGTVFIRNGSHITFLGRDIGSLFVRILYYKDALPVILRHPFGTGYLGYRALEATFQTSRYTVSFVHNGLLQILLDVGWIPGLLFILATGKALFSSRVTPTAKLALLVLSGHSLLDFDLQFFLFWGILLLCLDWDSGKSIQIRKRKLPAAFSAAVILVVSLWLGLGDLFYQTGNYRKALLITPFHTDALAEIIKTTSDADELDHWADKILAQNPTHSLAYSAKANAAFSRGNVKEMILHKEKALQYAPYSIEEYCDYIDKLYIVMGIYMESGDYGSAAFCLEKILSIPSAMENVAAKTDPLAYQTGNSTQMSLPDTYQDLLSVLSEANLIS